MNDLPTTMKGVQLVKYGSPKESLQYSEEIPVPKIKSPTQVLVHIKAAGVNPAESKAAAGNLKFATFAMKLPTIIGGDFAGIVVAKGDKVTDFAVGDEVFGSQPRPFMIDGTYAEYTVVDTTKASIAKKPHDVSFEQAASAGIAFITAYEGIVNNGNITEKNKTEKRNILVVGASGGVGSYGVEVAKAINPENHVVGISSTANIEFVKSLGADQVIDYKDQAAYQEFLKTTDKFDIVFDCVGGDDYYNQLDHLLTKKGVFSTAVGPIEHVGSSNVGLVTVGTLVGKVAYRKLFGSHTYAMIVGLRHSEFRSKMAPLFTNDKVRGTVYKEDSKVPLRKAYEAYEMLNSHRTVGKIVLVIE
jgi:NADPH:quinone reductase-like Zn-dependent oxidoreductase